MNKTKWFFTLGIVALICAMMGITQIVLFFSTILNALFGFAVVLTLAISGLTHLNEVELRSVFPEKFQGV